MLSDPQSDAEAIDGLRRRSEQHPALAHLKARKQEARFGLKLEWLPHGDGLRADKSGPEMDAAEKEFRAAQAEKCHDRPTTER